MDFFWGGFRAVQRGVCLLGKCWSGGGSFCFHLCFFFFDIFARRIGLGVGFADFEDVAGVVTLHVDVNSVVGAAGRYANFWFRHEGGFNWFVSTWELSQRNYLRFGLLFRKRRIGQLSRQKEIKLDCVRDRLTKEWMTKADMEKAR